MAELQLEKVKFIQNPKSGLIKSPLFIKMLIEKSLEGAHFEYDFSTTQYSGHAHNIAKECIEKEYDAVVAVGGDGTANEIASALVHSNVAMGIIPTGSGNGLARGVNIPVSVRRSTRLLLHGRTTMIDAGKIENKYYFVVSGVGFDALVGKLFNDINLRGPLPYFTIGFREFLYYRPEVFILRFDGKQVVAPALLIAVANAKQWGVGAIISPKAKIDDGMLDVCIIRKIKLLYALYHFPKLFTGKIDKIRKYERYQTSKLEIIREKPGPYHSDGESGHGGTCLKYSVEPHALKIIVPKNSS